MFALLRGFNICQCSKVCVRVCVSISNPRQSCCHLTPHDESSLFARSHGEKRVSVSLHFKTDCVFDAMLSLRMHGSSLAICSPAEILLRLLYDAFKGGLTCSAVFSVWPSGHEYGCSFAAGPAQ